MTWSPEPRPDLYNPAEIAKAKELPTVTEIRQTLAAWSDWRYARADLTPDVERVEAVYTSDMLPPSLKEAIRLGYLVPGLTKRKYKGNSPTAYHVTRKLAEETVAHFMGKMGDDRTTNPT